MENIGSIVTSTPIKNDNQYLIEFVNHYLGLGFDKVYLYDNNDNDAILPTDLLKDYISNGTVEIINYRNQPFDDMYHRRDFFTNYNFDWVLFVDNDEFLVLPKHKTIKEFLSTFVDDVTKILINYIHYGSSGQIYYTEGNVQDRITIPMDEVKLNLRLNHGFKSIFKKRGLPYDLSNHTIFDDKPFYNTQSKIVEPIGEHLWELKFGEETHENAYIKHYSTKSMEEYIKFKMHRTKFKYSQRFNKNYYFLFNEKTDEMSDLFDQMYNSTYNN